MKLIYYKIKILIIFMGLISCLLKTSHKYIAQAHIINGKSIQSNLNPQVSSVKNQSIEGLWIGEFTQNHEPKLWKIRMMLSQRGQIIEGTSFHKPVNRQVSVTYKLKGILDDNGTFNFIEGKMLDINTLPGWRFCNITGKLSLVFSKKHKIMKGYWECFSEGKRHFGKIVVRKH